VVFETPTNPKSLTIKITGGADFSYRIIPVQGNSYLRVYKGDTNPFTFTRPSGTGKWTKVAVVVVGGASGGSYTITLSELAVTYVQSDAYYQWYHHDYTKGPSCENVQKVGVDSEFKTVQRLPIRLAASCGTNAWANTTIQRIEPTHIAIDFSAYAHSLYKPDPADPLNRISGAAHGTEGLISAGTYTVEINPVISYSWLSTEYVGIEFRLYPPDSLDPYMTFGCTEMPPYSQLCSLPITREITIPENEMHRWTFYVAADTGFDDGDPETIQISGRALSIKRKEE